MRDAYINPLRRQQGSTGRITRRTLMARAAASGLAASALTTIDGSTRSNPVNSISAVRFQEQGTPGGTLRVAHFDEAPTLDVHVTTSRETAQVSWHIYETLFAWNTSYEPIPMLAESHEISDDQLTHTLRIRQGVPFHNGQELTGADVVASLQRWATRNSIGREMLEIVEEIIEVDDYTLEFQFTEPYAIFASAFGIFYQGCAIYPASVVEAAGDGEISEYIGTGPYKFADWTRGRAIRLERFEEYAALPGEPDGYGGHKYAYLDAIEFSAVSDEAARVAGLRSGDYGYIERISGDQVPGLEGDDSVVVAIVAGSGWDMLNINWKSQITGDLKIRQAIQAALNCEPILIGGRGEGFFELSPSLMPEGTIWYTEAGSDLYNQANQDKARQLLEESGYDGAPLRAMTTQADLTKFQASVVIKQQLEEVGFVIDLQIYDWATVNERRNEEDVWELYVTNTSFRPEPTMLNPMKLCSYAGWWCSDTSEAVLADLLTESDFDSRFQSWEQLQTLAFEEVPNVYLGQTSDIFAHAGKLQGVTLQAQLSTILWNAWIDE